MHLAYSIFSLLTLIHAANSQMVSLTNKTATPHYYLRTSLPADQTRNSHLNNLYLSTYHSGAGLSEAIFEAERNYSLPGYLNRTSAKSPLGTQVFDRGSALAWYFDFEDFMESGTQAWAEVAINAGATGMGVFFINENGLRWSSADGVANTFGGWAVCDWWHGSPQLFIMRNDWGIPLPCGCSEINLVPEYV